MQIFKNGYSVDLENIAFYWLTLESENMGTCFYGSANFVVQ